MLERQINRNTNVHRRTITEADREAANNLWRHWERFRQEQKCKGQKPMSQRKAGEILGMGQSAVSQYLRGEIALGTDATLKFAALLKIRPDAIRKDFSFADLVPGDLSPEAISLASVFELLDPKTKSSIKDLIENMVETRRQK